MGKYFKTLIAAVCLGLLFGSAALNAQETGNNADDMFQNVEDFASDSDENQASDAETMPQDENPVEDGSAPTDAHEEESMMDGIMEDGPPVVAWPGGRR